ncbi:MAG: [acyl-carrier-protein] S-malonyltransferase [Gammaproteobacteria bacterium]|nr:MAG: [acyl-carrier-protein] S-malonyltransferase [Gammaproteobacteria bacterium]RLA54959.1 MAG: [acyl-carrier-protein] S-malonyltransferase [Gammaproteobacteria bacterium]
MSVNSKLAFVFPGQGSQKIGMLAEIASEYSIVAETFAEAAEVLGYDAWDMLQNGEQDDINQTERTQPILLTASVSLWRVWAERQGQSPALLAGHSLGEWSALVCAGVVEFVDAVNLVRLRGAYMQEAVPRGQGAMAAVLGLDDVAIKACCEQAAQGEEVVPVNFNAPGQVVIAGTSSGVERAIVLCKEAGAKRAMPLAVSAPFHTQMMKPAADKLATHLTQVAFNAPQIPVVQNVRGEIETDSQKIRDLMIEQIYSPVQWVDCVKTLVSQGVQVTVECGPGKVLCGLNKRIDKSLQSLSTDTLSSLGEALETAG